MKIAIIGATGFVGSHILTEALSRNYDVTAIARDTTKIQSKSNHLTSVPADVDDVDALAKILTGEDVVISAYNAGWSNPNLYQDFLKGSENIEAAAKQAGVKRLIVIGGAGSLFINGKQLVDDANFPAEYRAGAQSARDYLTILSKEQHLAWTFFSPAIEMHPGITTGRTGKYRLGLDNPVFDANGKSVLSVEDLAVAILDEVENKQFIRKRFTAAY